MTIEMMDQLRKRFEGILIKGQYLNKWNIQLKQVLNKLNKNLIEVCYYARKQLY